MNHVDWADTIGICTGVICFTIIVVSFLYFGSK